MFESEPWGVFHRYSDQIPITTLYETFRPDVRDRDERPAPLLRQYTVGKAQFIYGLVQLGHVIALSVGACYGTVRVTG